MSDPQRMPSRWWYAIAAAVFVLGLVPLAVISTNAITGLFDYQLHRFDDGTSTTLQIDGDDVAIYTSYEGVGTVRCAGLGSGVPVPENPPDATALAGPLNHPAWDFSFTTGPEVWHRVAVTPAGWDDGAYQVVCSVVSSGAGNPQPDLAYAGNPSFLGTALGLLISFGVAALATLAALAIAIAVAVKRNRAKRPPLPRRPTLPTAPPQP